MLRSPPRTVLWAVVLLFWPVVSAATTVGVTYSHRQIPDGNQPDPSILEGSIVARFVASEPVDLASPDTSMTQISSTEYEHVFLWNWSAPKSVDFVDGAGDTINAVAAPVPIYPFDPVVHSVPVVHIRTDSSNLWRPDSGIYVWGDNNNFLQRGEEWERPATIDYYEPDGTLAFSEPIGLRIHGNSTRTNMQKSLRIYFDGYGTSNEIDHDFFGTSPTVFRRLILRQGRRPSFLYFSNFAEGIMRDLGHLGSRYRFVVAYLNGEYWGCYSLRERYDERFVEHTHELENNDYVLVRDVETIHGDGNEWWNLVSSFSEPADHGSHEWYVQKSGELDLDTYIDWLFINAYAVSADNGFRGNVSHLKIRDDPFQYLMWDEDAIMNLSNVENDHLRFYASADSAEFTQFVPPVTWWTWTPEMQQYCNIFRSFMENSEFKARFSNRVEYLLSGPMSLDSLTARIGEFATEQAFEVPMHDERWDWQSVAPNWYSFSINRTLTFLNTRHPIMLQQFPEFMEHFRVPVELSQFEALGHNGQVDLGWQTESEEDNVGFTLYRSVGSPDAMVQIASHETHPELVGQLNSSTPTQYFFVDDTAVAQEINYYQLHHVDGQDSTTMHQWIVSATPQRWDDLVVNEFSARNDSLIADEFGEYDDWIEIHNTGPDTLLLDGAYLTDDLANPTRQLLAGGITLGPGEHLLFWADGDTAQGPLHLNFRLGGEGEQVGLVHPNGTSLVDSVSFDLQIPDRSYARYPDGEAWSYNHNPTPGAPNVAPTPQRFFVLNEIMTDNQSTVVDDQGELDPWLEIHNPLPVPLALDGLWLTDTALTPTLWALPGSTLPGLGHLLLWGDGETGEGPLHTSFALNGAGGFLGLYDLDGVTAIDGIDYAALGPDTSLARIPDGSGPWILAELPTPGATNQQPAPTLYINEFLAKNDGFNQDPGGGFDDWIELYNPGPDPVPLGGLFLTDNLANPTQWEIPETTMAPGSFLLVWCDDEAFEGPLHATFKLAAGGEEVGLFGSLAQGNVPIDTYVYGAQSSDVSEARLIDGALPWIFLAPPTPGASNFDPTGVEGFVTTGSLRLLPIRPNPTRGASLFEFFAPRSGFATLDLFDVHGRRVVRLFDGAVDPGQHVLRWNGNDHSGSSVASGVYFLRLVHDSDRRVRRFTLLR